MMPFKEIIDPITALISPLGSMLGAPDRTVLDRNINQHDGEVASMMLTYSQSLADNRSLPMADDFVYSCQTIWRDAFGAIASNRDGSKEQSDLLRRVDYSKQVLVMSPRRMKENMSTQEIIERDHSFAMKESFHLADEDEARAKYIEAMKIIVGIQKQKAKTGHEWVWMCLEILDRLKLKVHYDDFVTEPLTPWPHRYMAQDIVQAFVMMVSIVVENVKKLFY